MRICLKKIGLAVPVALCLFASEIRSQFVISGSSDLMVGGYRQEQDAGLYFSHPAYFESAPDRSHGESGHGLAAKKARDKSPVHIYQRQLRHTAKAEVFEPGNVLFYLDTESHHTLNERPSAHDEHCMQTMLFDTLLSEVHL